MNRWQTCTAAAALLFVAHAGAQYQQTPPGPSTSETEGTAADRTEPGRTPTRDADIQSTTPRAPQPSTSPTEGTAADRTPPGKTPTTSAAAGSARSGSEMIGTPVVSSDEASLGKVVDVVFDAKGQPEFVVISTEQGRSAAVPYQAASSMKSGDKVVMDESRLQRAPTMKQGEWQHGDSKEWKEKSMRYWKKG